MVVLRAETLVALKVVQLVVVKVVQLVERLESKKVVHLVV
jgi:hypothetical protein